MYAYAKAGAAVLITARRFERLEAIREELAAQDYRVEAVACDVREEEQVRETVKHAFYDPLGRSMSSAALQP